MSRTGKRPEDARSGHVGAWTAMGIVKRLDDQKRLIDRMHRELDELKATRPFEGARAPESRKIAELVEALETALTTNKRLTDSVIRIRERLYEILQENKKLRIDIELLKSRGLATHVQRSALSRGALELLKAVAAGAKSSTEMSRIVERSREHTSRTVKKLVDLRLLETTDKTFPAKYVLTEAGRQLLNSEVESTSE